jgi:hypothetical protein
MKFDLQDAVALLTRTPATLDALLRGLPEPWVRANEGESTWNAAEVVGHLIHSERINWVPRARWILEFGESEPFPPFERLTKPGERLENLLEEFASMRRDSIAGLESMLLGPEDFERKGRHPTFGEVTLSQLLATWVAHDLTHLHQISRILAHQYREAVGPWSRFLGVMQCSGHSSAA